MSPDAPATSRAGRREWLALAVLALPCIVYAMDLTVLHLAVPSISADLGPSGTELLWIVDIYGFVTAGLLVTMGTLGDRIGRRRLLLIGSATFAAASVAAAFATSVEMLIAARALLGAAGATLAPSTLSLIRELFEDQRQRTTAVGVWIASFSTGAAIGPLVGGVLLEHFDWGSVFLAALPVMALVLAVGPRLLPEYRAPDAGRIDARSVVLSIAAVLPVVYGLKHLARDGWDLTGPLTFAAGIVLALAFVRRQRRLDDPLLDLRLFGSPGFNAALAANGLGFFVNFGFALFVAQYLQAVLGLSTLTAGLWSLPAAVAFIVGSMVTPKVAAQVSAPNVVAGGLGVAAGGFALLTQVGVDVGLASAVAGSVLSAIGLSAVFTLAADLMVGSAPPQRAGGAAAVAETSSELGGALGVAVLGAIGAAVYRGALPTGSADTIGQAILVGGDAADAAREAFVQGMQIAAGVSAALVLAAAAGVLAAHRRRTTIEPALNPAASAGAPA
jgi:DHA2 family multidrug resistance protein-like MFS transporter